MLKMRVKIIFYGVTELSLYGLLTENLMTEYFRMLLCLASMHINSSMH